RLAAQLSRMRGAAMKVGQLVSMETGQFLPPQLAVILEGLQAGADHMPERQLRTVLNQAWGDDWQTRFSRFDMTPIAAASIGQVHRAVTRDGRVLAVKVQYPGVRASIDSDVDNLGMLLRLSGLLPQGLDMAPMLAEARQQLHAEADYLAEAANMTAYAKVLGDRPGIVMPAPDAALTSDQVLAMDFIDSRPIDSLVTAPAATRDRVGQDLVDLAMDELFTFNLMQTDPNFANYRWQGDSGRIVLLDFGALRGFSPDLAPKYKTLLRAGLAQDQAALQSAAIDIGYLAPNAGYEQRVAVLQMLDLALAPLRRGGVFDAAETLIPQQIADIALRLSRSRRAAHMPPPEVMFLHRKLGGMFLLMARLRVRIDLDRLLARLNVS
ncbi:MAG: AarF/ABC1/UbiB kinase family protein, partial [Paracoccus sp. (in: a-proteobacteria)]|uniref:ABC1 kinase family protein n=1 Tax=Paracoccus sp. TaxID=267 RepID=UPI003242BB55